MEYALPLIAGFGLGTLATLVALFGWLAYQAAQIDRDQNREAYHQSRDPRETL